MKNEDSQLNLNIKEFDDSTAAYLQRMRSTPLRLGMSIQTLEDFIAEHDGKAIKFNSSDFSTFDPFECANFSNPYTWDETIEKIKLGGFQDYGDFFEIVLKLKSHDVEAYKKWWLEDTTKDGALKLLEV